MTTKKEAYIALRNQGYSYRKIGDLFGASRQSVYAAINYSAKPKPITIYTNIDEFARRNGTDIGQLACFIEDKGISNSEYGRWWRILHGEQQPKKSDIDKLIARTGIPYGELFALEEKEEL